MYEVFFTFYNCNEDIKPSAAFSWRHIKYKIHATERTKTRHFYFKNSKIFWGGAQPPSQTPRQQEGTPPPAPIHSAPAAPQSSRWRSLTHPPTRKSGYGPVYSDTTQLNSTRRRVVDTFTAWTIVTDQFWTSWPSEGLRVSIATQLELSWVASL